MNDFNELKMCTDKQLAAEEDKGDKGDNSLTHSLKLTQIKEKTLI